MTHIYTIGYEGCDINAFVGALLANGIEHLIDVRDFPGSRKRGFSKTALSEVLESNGVRYTHLKWLGDPKEGREAARNGDYKEFRRVFFNRLRKKESRKELKTAAKYCKTSASTLMCYEKDPTYCHRSIVAGKISMLLNREIKHLSVIDDLHNKSAAKRRKVA